MSSQPRTPGQLLTTSRRRALQLLGVGSGTLLLAACGAAATPVSPAPTTAPPTNTGATPAAAPTTASVQVQPTAAPNAAGTPRTGGTMRAVQAGDLASLDGHYYTPSNGLSVWIIFDTLTAYDDNLQPQPALAESWDQSSDATQIKLNLRKGVQFHSGREMTSDDIIYNLNRILDFKLTAGIITGFVPPETTWTNPDKYTVILNAKQPWAAVFDFFQVLNIIDKDIADGPDAKTKAGGTGPFTFVEWVQGDHVTYGKNKNYWQSGIPYFDGITMALAKDQQAMVAQFEAGDVDFMLNPPLRDYVRLTDDPKYQGLELPNPAAFWMLQPNSTRPPMDDKRVRQALNYAINRQRMIDTVLLGMTTAQDLPWPAASPASQPEKNGVVSYDLDKAKSLLADAGATNWTLDLLYSAVSQEGAGYAQIYQADLAQIGVNGVIRTLQPAALLDAWHTQNYGLYFASDPWANLEPVTQFTSGSTTNYRGNNGGYLNDDYTKLVTAAATEPDSAKRKALYSQLNDFLIDAAFVYPLGMRQTRSVARANLKDVGHRRNEMYTFYKAWLA
ncbi:MAG: ABC transporter substrate-binding protein [Chloroflexi bacterium]|nr:ABC transporter substrate-binding protein [Chloroflexota bacterium]MBV9603239.1 ABC transporter substrate-binding protein [Chloroflexota bacterium]